MPFAAKSAVPQTAGVTLRQPILERAAEAGVTLFTAPPGYLLTESLAAALAERGRPIVWLRLGPEDHDPATFLLSLISAAQRVSPRIGAATLEQMRRQPGPIAGWPPLFALLAHELAGSLPASSALVLEHIHYLEGTHSTSGLLTTCLLPALPAGIACILTSPHRLSHVALPSHSIHRDANDLRINAATAVALVERADAGLPAPDLDRIVALTEGRGEALVGLYTARAVLGSTVILHAMERAVHADDLLMRVARAWLAAADARSQQALALALRLEYSHPALLEAAIGRSDMPSGPWSQPLADGWARVRAVWRAPLQAALRAAAHPDHAALRRAAHYLAGRDATECAVPLYLDIGDVASAGEAMTRAADTMIGLGQWDLLGEWLGRLPASTLRTWPWLIYSGGEIAAGQGELDTARCAFALAAALFTARHEADGACQSLLAESTLAAWLDDRALAQTRALAAVALAEAGGLAWNRGWAEWQLGCLAATDGDLDNALVYFGRGAAAADAASDPLMAELYHQAESLALQQRELHRQRELAGKAYYTLERAEEATADTLRQLVSTPSGSLDALLDAHGWSRTPLMLKLPAPLPLEKTPVEPERTNVWDTLLRVVGLRRRPTTPPAAPAATANVPLLNLSPPIVAALGGLLLTASGTLFSGAPDTSSTVEPSAAMPGTALSPIRSTETELPGAFGPAVEPSTSPSLTAYLLGQFRVTLIDHAVENWPGGRARNLVKYLLTHRDQPAPRDVLMDVFWPNATPESARNSLNVALHTLRQTLRAAADVPVIVFEDGAYHLNPDLRLWLDVDEFERRVQAGRRLEAAGQLAAATGEYEVAVALYHGDFLPDDPYEEWTILPRERLRVTYLDTLERLSHIYFGQGQYAACATLCQLILARDNCREDAHCRLMRCYSRQGQHHLALRQYQTCVEVLRAELDVAPAQATTQLYERIRRHEPV